MDQMTVKQDFALVLRELVQMRQQTDSKNTYDRVLTEMLERASKEEAFDERLKRVEAEKEVALLREQIKQREIADERVIAERSAAALLRKEERDEAAVRHDKLVSTLVGQQQLMMTMLAGNIKSGSSGGNGVDNDNKSFPSPSTPKMMTSASTPTLVNESLLDELKREKTENAQRLAREREESRQQQTMLVAKLREQQEMFVKHLATAGHSDNVEEDNSWDEQPAIGEITCEREQKEGETELRELETELVVTELVATERASTTTTTTTTNVSLAQIADEIYSLRTNKYAVNLKNIKCVVDKCQSTLAPLLNKCPRLPHVLAHMLILRLGVRVEDVSFSVEMTAWTDEDARSVGRSMATFLRNNKTGGEALEAWRLQYPMLVDLFEVEGFESFMLTITNNLLRDNKIGIAFRVSVGAALSTIDAATDIYVVTNYYKSDELIGQAQALLAMISLNLLAQIHIVSFAYQSKSWSVKLKEAIICILFLRPIVDAFRIGTNHNDKEKPLDSLSEMAVNKEAELATESIPGCVLQLYVWFLNREAAGTYALVSICISALTTGFTSAMIAFDTDADASRRKSQPRQYGYLPDNNGLRGRCFVLMTMISALHNISRSTGVALLAISGGWKLVAGFIGAEMSAFFLMKIVRQDFWHWGRTEGANQIISAVSARLMVKLVVDFSGCIHFRHPYELGGAAFSATLVWAQAMPFVALWLFDEGDEKGLKKTITTTLFACFGLWTVLNAAFFCTIDLSYLHTFFGTKTAPQYTCELWLTSKEDSTKFRAAFKNRIAYTKAIHPEVKAWVAENIQQWKIAQPAWFVLEKIPDEFLPLEAFKAAGGFGRRRSSVSLREMIVGPAPSDRSPPRATTAMRTSEIDKQITDAWKAIAADVYAVRSNNFKSNFLHVRRIFDENETIVAPLLKQCPEFKVILSYVLEDRIAFRVRKVDYKSLMSDWGEEECRRVGCSVACFLRNRKTSDAAVGAWRLHYAQLNQLFEIVGFEDFMLVIASNTLRDSVYGTVYRVSVGAFLSILDAITDIYVLTQYYRAGISGQANALLAMIASSMLFQILGALATYKKSSWLREIMICMFFLRPAVDAYRVSTNYDNEDTTLEALQEMIINKCSELAGESIPGCVLQLFVLLSKPKEAGRYALVSIGVSALTTGFASAMISFDLDVDVPHRKNQPEFYGYIPDDNGLRTRSFILMILTGALHNLSRSMGVALLAVSGGFRLVMAFVGGEMVAYLGFKMVRGDFWYWLRGSGVANFIAHVNCRLAVKIIVDYSGCLHFRHPFEMGGLAFSLNLLWSQVMPFVALQLYNGDEETKTQVTIGLAGCFGMWMILNVVFFSTIDLSYVSTFFETITAPKYTCKRFLETDDDAIKWDAFVTNNIDYTKAIHPEVKEWVATNIGRWRLEEPKWFKVDMIPDEFLPAEIFAAEGGFGRRRSSVSFIEIVGLGVVSRVNSRQTISRINSASAVFPITPVVEDEDV